MSSHSAMIGLVCVAVTGLMACSQPLATLDDTIETPLTDTAGDADRGRIVFSSRDAGHCVLCHVIDGLDTPFQGDVGPSLTHIGDRLSAGQLRLRIVDPRRVWPDTVMPAYGSVADLNQVDPAFAGQAILSAQDIEDLVTYLGAEREGSP